ncbi:MAG: translocation/assembly module TamB domain-containing protein [Planctomycetota bacterium]|jgi:hypothetical protein
MGTEKDSKPERKKRKIRIVKWVLLAVLLLIVLGVLLVPVFVSSGKGRQIILAKINDSVSGKTDFAALSMGWWKGIEVTDFSFNDDAEQILVRIKQVATKPHYVSLLMGSLSFGETRIDKPSVEIDLSKRAPEEAERPREEAEVAAKARAPVLPVKKIDLTVKEGNLKVTGAKAATVELSQINSKVNLRPAGQETNFGVDMTVVEEGKEAKVHAEGRVQPSKRTGWTLKGTSGDLTVEVSDLDLESLGPILALAGVEIEAKGSVSCLMKSKIADGQVENLSGSVKGKSLDVTGEQLKGDRLRTSVLDVGVKLQGEKELIKVDELQIKSDWLDAELSGAVPMTFKSLAELADADSPYNLKADLECDLAQALSQMPRTLGLKEGMRVTSGRLACEVKTATKAGKKQITGSANLVGLAGEVGGKTIALSEPVTVEAAVASGEAGVKIDKLDVSASFAKVGCTGSSKLLQYSAEVDLGKLQSELGEFVNLGRYKVAGEFSSKGEVAGDKHRITAAGSSRVKELRLSSPEGVSASEPKADIAFSVAVESDRNILDVNYVRAKGTLGAVAVEDSVVPLSKEAADPIRLAVSADNVNLEKVQPFAVLFASFPEEMQLAGTVKSDVMLSSKKDTYYISTDATHIANLKVAYADKKPFEQAEVSLVADAEVNPTEKTFAVKKLKVESPQIKISKGEISRVSRDGKSKLEGRVECEYDWAAVSVMASPYLLKGLEVEGQRKDIIDFSSEYPSAEPNQLVANLDTQAKLGFERAGYMGLHFGPTEVGIKVENGLATIEPFSTTVNKGQLNFAGKADFKEKPTLLQIPGPTEIAKDIQINDETTKRLFMYLNPIFAGAVNVSGKVSFGCEQLAIPLGAGAKERIQIIGTVSGDDIILSPGHLLGQLVNVSGLSGVQQELRLHPTRFILWDGFLRYEDMQIDVGDNPFNFKGVIGLDGSLNMTALLPLTIEGKTIRVGQEADRKRISVPLRGTIEKPELDLGKLLEEQLRKGLLEGLDKILK